jgi:hypothetical protein
MPSAVGSNTYTITSNIPADGTYTCTVSYKIDATTTYTSTAQITLSIDRNTLPATLTLPLAGTTYTNPIPVSLNLGEINAPGTLNLTFEYTDGTYSNTLTLVNNTPSQTFTFTNNNIWPTSNVTTATHTTLMDGLYNVTLTYQDIYSNPLFSTTNYNVRIQANTPLPTLSNPITGSVLNGTSTPTFSYALPSAPFSGTARLTFTSSDTSYVYILPNQVGSNTFTITTNPPQDGTYSWTVRYQDFLGNPTATSSTSIVVFDRATLSPTITSPLTNAINTGTATITFSTPESALPGSKKIFISQNDTLISTINIVDNNTGTLNLNFKDLTVSNSQITSVSGTTNIPDGTYSLTYSYKDVANNTAASSSINVSIDVSTLRILINAPLPNSIVTNNLNLKFTLPEAMLSGSLKLQLKSTTNNLFFTLADLAPNTYDWNINPSVNILTTYPTRFTSVSPSTITNIPAGTYTLTMIYQDAIGNRTDSGMYISNIKIKPTTLTPILRSPQTNSYISRTLILIDTILENNLVGSKKITIFKNNNAVTTITLKDLPSDTLYFDTHRLSEIGTKISSITGIDSLVDGEYVIQLSYQDVYSNPAASASSSITIDNSPLTGVLSHTGKIVYGTFTETLTFNKPVISFNSNSIIPNIINNSPSATFGSFIPNSNKTIYTFTVTPLQQGIIKIQGPVEGIARDIAGNPSKVIAVDSVKYIDTLQLLTPVISGNVSFCQGDSVILTSSLANSYLWSTGDTTRSIVVKKGGDYNVKTRYDDNVKGISSNVTIILNPIPSAPLLSRDANNNLVSSSKTGNNWYLNGNKLNDTSNTIKPNTAGNYNARTIQLGCASAIGPNYYYVLTNLHNISANEFIKLTPNPFVNNVNVDFYINGYQSLKLEVFDINTGNLVIRKDRIDAGLNIQLPAMASGVYLFKLSTNDGKISRQFKMVKL